MKNGLKIYPNEIFNNQSIKIFKIDYFCRYYKYIINNEIKTKNI